MTQIVNRCLGQVHIDLSLPFEKIFDWLSNSIKEWKEFIEYCGELGWELKFRDGKSLENVSQIKKFSKLGDIVVSKIMPKIQEPEEEEEQKKEGEEENADD